MRSLPFAALALLLSAGACRTPSGTDAADGTAPRDTNWIGEARITAGDTTIRLCGSGKRYRLTGPALDSLAPKYRYFRTRPGQWMKVWCTGHLGVVGPAGRPDSALITGTFQHLDASLQCDPVPDGRMAGSYAVDFQDPTGARSVRFDLFEDGLVTMYTSNGHGSATVEEDGRWGVDSDDRVILAWPAREQSMRYAYTEGTLTSDMPGAGSAVVLRRTGPADRMYGAFGRTARWLAAQAAASGQAVRAEDLRPSTRLATLFPTPESRTALRAAAADTLRLNDQRMRLEWDAVEDVQGAADLMRMRIRLAAH